MELKIPNHVAIILDGNGRWAKSKGMPRNYGHTMGAKNVEVIARAADALGIRYVTMYAFSTENWNRPSSEVSALMKLLDTYLKKCLKSAKKNNTRIRIIGDITALEEKLQDTIHLVEEETSVCTGLTLTIAINYGSRDEMIRAMKKMMKDYDAGKISIDDINETKYASYLDTSDMPDPDLLIRTSGEQRLSNYLLWQFAYSEFYFTEVPWPDFNEQELRRAVEAYSARDRRYGGIKEEVDSNV